MTYLGEIGPVPKLPERIEDKDHLNFIRQLPCVCTGIQYAVDAHHLLRCSSRRGMYKAGDNHTLPLTTRKHRELHDKWGDETAFFEEHGITDPEGLAEQLYEHSGDITKALELIQEARQ